MDWRLFHNRGPYLYLYLQGGQHAVLSSAEAVISFDPMFILEITERLYKSL